MDIEHGGIAYQTEKVTLWWADSRQVAATIPTESVDLIVTDPPYGVAFQSNTRTEKFALIEGDEATETARADVNNVIEQCVRIVKQNGHLYVFGPDDALAGLKVRQTVQLIWDKGLLGSGQLSLPWGPQHELINFAVSAHRHAGKTGDNSLPARTRKGSILRFNRPTGRNVRHPTEKPVALLQELIESSSRQGDTVFDPYAGVGSTGIAAILTGRNALLIETNRDYIDIAINRIKQAQKLAKQMRAA